MQVQQVRQFLPLQQLLVQLLLALFQQLLHLHTDLKKHIELESDDYAINNRCYADMDLDSSYAWAVAHNKLNSYYKWKNKIWSKTIKETNYCDGEYCYPVFIYTNYLCAAVGAPSLVFALVQIIGLALFYSSLVLSINGAGSDNSINENDENISNQPRGIEEQQQQQPENNEKIDENNANSN